MSTAPSRLRKSALSIAMGLCLASLAAAPAPPARWRVVPPQANR